MIMCQKSQIFSDLFYEHSVQYTLEAFPVTRFVPSRHLWDVIALENCSIIVQLTSLQQLCDTIISIEEFQRNVFTNLLNLCLEELRAKGRGCCCPVNQPMQVHNGLGLSEDQYECMKMWDRKTWVVDFFQFGNCVIPNFIFWKWVSSFVRKLHVQFKLFLWKMFSHVKLLGYYFTSGKNSKCICQNFILIVSKHFHCAHKSKDCKFSKMNGK